MASYYQGIKPDPVEGANMCKKSISLAISIGNNRMHGSALNNLAWVHIQLGEYSQAQIYAHKAQRLASVSGNLFTEALACYTESMCWTALGHYNQSLSLCIMAQSLLSLCGMSDSQVNLGIMTIQAEVHKYKSEYTEAWKIHMEIAEIAAERRDAYLHAIALMNVAEIEVLIGAPKCDVEQTLKLARSIYTIVPWFTTFCDSILGDLHLREKDLCAARLLLEESLRSDYVAQLKPFCLERLGNTSLWGGDYAMHHWTTIFLVYSLKGKQTLQVHKALQFFGDTFLHQQDEDTAITLFTVALEGFTYMDVHQSRAECMLRLGDIFNNHGDWLKAVEFWTTAQLLFKRSSQAKQVECVDERLARMGNDVLKQHRENIAHLVELNVLSGSLSVIEDEKQVELIEV
jgi:tetratricopeptide (TPR) repeat protein